jgi:hypothetical protein
MLWRVCKNSYFLNSTINSWLCLGLTKLGKKLARQMIAAMVSLDYSLKRE